MQRPLPPESLRSSEGAPDWVGGRFEPARELYDFLRTAFLEEGAPFWREEYSHLAEARIGVLWTTVPKDKGMVSWAASAELVTTGGDAWTKGRSLQQLLDWFGDWWGEEQEVELPDFVLTFYAPAAVAMNDLGFCATCAHELRHCSVKRDRYGEIRYDPEDRPIWAVLEHDVTEFLSVVEDFGPVGRNVAQLAELALRAPRFPGAVVEGICGTCGAAVLPAAA